MWYCFPFTNLVQCAIIGVIFNAAKLQFNQFSHATSLQQGNTYLDSSSYSINLPQLSQEQHYVSAGETSISENVVNVHNHVLDNTNSTTKLFRIK
ncbi:5110_t:CDS:2 [Funneliformis mosseae]|uniref:5110_t:CDS:1 n=1 Tax=Funneliformis mosseae TaxID=27381 RepID=A0A9N9E936_FUNMO|nr:5110_t:CDS:2 [Funneliformis mosseae]